jgi:hypothetical protein
VKPSTAATSSATPAAPPSTGETKALSMKEEAFAKLVALGMSQSEAYRRATGTKAKDESVWESASRMAVKVSSRIQELREEAKAKANGQYVYEYQDAMRECDEALEMAKVAGDSGAMSKAIALKAKLSGLETDPRKNAREPFEGVTDDELIDGINRDIAEAGCTIQ